ncbi:unnamed protein product [Brassica oleracea var. botrytis]|uniref:(rape) hypothetical protein n=1 Tax=Brassica napus TaxID=3708 RepID=A0A816L439_BRANA|nr:unnamed protein product [Brassica napus]
MSYLETRAASATIKTKLMLLYRLYLLPLSNSSKTPSSSSPICSGGCQPGAWLPEALFSHHLLCALLRFHLSLQAVDILGALEGALPRGPVGVLELEAYGSSEGRRLLFVAGATMAVW